MHVSRILIGIVSLLIMCVSTYAVWRYASSRGAGLTDSQGQTSGTYVPLHARIVVDSPQAHQTIGHEFTVSGKAPGPWFFEAVFPIKVLADGPDGEHTVLATAQAHAVGDWMTESLVSFTAHVTIVSGYQGPATIVLLKDNPSGLPEHDDSLEIPIVLQ